jgi:hypothetical protein
MAKNTPQTAALSRAANKLYAYSRLAKWLREEIAEQERLCRHLVVRQLRLMGAAEDVLEHAADIVMAQVYAPPWLRDDTDALLAAFAGDDQPEVSVQPAPAKDAA